MKYLKAFILLLCLSASCDCIAQEIYAPNYTRRDGIPSSRIYQVLQDRQGFLWLCTDNGVCRFNGNSFTTFNREDGFIDYGAFHMFLDSHNRLWFLTFTGELWYYQYGKFQQLPVKHPQSKDIKWVDEDKNGNIYLSTSKGGMFKIHPDFSFEFIQTRLPTIVGFVVLNDSTIFIMNPYPFSILVNFKTLIDPHVEGMMRSYSAAVKLKDNSLLVTSEKGILRYSRDSFSLALKPEQYNNSVVISMTYDSIHNVIWVGTRKGAFRIKDEEGKLSITDHFFQNQSVSSCLPDRDGNMWFSCLYYGLIYKHENTSYWYSTPPSSIASNQFPFIIRTKKSLRFMNSVGDLYEIKNRKLTFICSISDRQSELFFNNFVTLKEGQTLVFADFKSLIIDGDMIKVNHAIDHTEGSSDCFYTTNDGEVVLLRWSNDAETEVDVMDGLIRKNKFPERTRIPLRNIAPIKTFAYENEAIQWFGNKDGLYRIIFKNGRTKVDRPYNLNHYVTSLCIGPDSVLWVSTIAHGLVALKNGQLIRRFSVSNGLLSNNIRKTLIDDQLNVWVVTYNGLNKISNPFSSHPNVISYNINNLLPSNEVLDVYVDQNTVYVATGNGIVTLERKNVIIPDKEVSVCYTKVKVGDKSVSLKHTPEALYGNPIAFYYDLPWFGIGEKAQYKYTISGFENQWHRTGQNVLTFNSLPPGTYTLQVLAVNPKITKSSPAFITFTILPKYWQTIWFKIVLFILIVSFIGFLLFRVFKNRQKSVEMSRQHAVSQLNALRAQINPHFIFNSLNSIQEFILDHQPRLANTYLSRFASLMRMIIENSKKDFISLHEEIEFLELYISLEKLRLNDDLTFEIKTGQDMDIYNMQLPPMILQPIVENAIKHGLSSFKHNRMLTIDFSLKNKGISCVVEDNGIGRAATAGNHSATKTHQSSIGLSATVQRLRLIYGEKNAQLQITDLTDNFGKPSGTRVEIFIPIT